MQAQAVGSIVGTTENGGGVGPIVLGTGVNSDVGEVGAIVWVVGEGVVGAGVVGSSVGLVGTVVGVVG